MAKQKFYVVWVGRGTGIFTDWASTSASVSGYPGAKDKSYSSREEAESACEFGGVSSSKPAKAVAPTESRAAIAKQSAPKALFIFDPAYDIHIFNDGACVPNPGNAGSGVSVYQSGKLTELHYGMYKPNGTNNTAELNALH
jgi:ribonuclease HI